MTICSNVQGLNLEKYTLGYVIPMSIFLIILSVFGVVLNSVVLYTIWKTPLLQTPSMILICSLAFTDFLVGTVVQPALASGMIIAYLKYCETINVLLDVIIVSGYSLATVSACTLIAISIDRFLAISTRQRYRIIVTKHRTLATVIFIWAIPSTTIITLSFFRKQIPYATTALSLWLVFALGIMMFFYGRSFCLLKEIYPKQARHLSHQSGRPPNQEASCIGKETPCNKIGTKFSHKTFSSSPCDEISHFYPTWPLSTQRTSSLHNLEETQSSSRRTRSKSVPHKGTPHRGVIFLTKAGTFSTQRSSFPQSLEEMRSGSRRALSNSLPQNRNSHNEGVILLKKALFTQNAASAAGVKIFLTQKGTAPKKVKPCTDQPASSERKASNTVQQLQVSSLYSISQVNKYKRTVITMVIVLICCVISYLPLTIYFANINDDAIYHQPYITHSLEIIVLLNSTVNPILYLWRMTDLRRAAKRKLQFLTFFFPTSNVGDDK